MDKVIVTAAITGGCVALVDAIRFLEQKNIIKKNPLLHLVAAVSVGIYQGVPVLDLDYAEDSNAEVDMNVVLTEGGNFIEVQGTAENGSFNRAELDILLDLAKSGSQQLFDKQKTVLTT